MTTHASGLASSGILFVCADEGFYKHQRPQMPACQLADSHFIDAFVQAGYSDTSAGGSLRAQRAGKKGKQDAPDDSAKTSAASKDCVAGWDDFQKPPRLGSLQMLLRLLVKFCNLQVVPRSSYSYSDEYLAICWLGCGFS